MDQVEKILLVDDDQEILKVYQQIFAINGFDISVASDGAQALKQIEAEQIAVVITDIIMPRLGGMELLAKVREVSPLTEVIVLTAEGSVSGAVESVKQGAFTYLVKPVEIDNLLLNVNKALDIYRIKSENALLRQKLQVGSVPMIGETRVIMEIRSKIATVAPTDMIVMLTGESGTGKEILANLIHGQSNRSHKPFVKVNCAALSESLLESELFGHERGAFTGAKDTYRGRFETVNHGTLLLDEIGELSFNAQAKLLRVLQEKEFERIGSTTTIKTDFRLITSTNRNLAAEVEKGRFRQDLFYRINAFEIHLPPLRQRKEDILLLADYFVAQYALEMKKSKPDLTREMLSLLEEYSWPGNIRQLKNFMERMVLLSSDGIFQVTDMAAELQREKARTIPPSRSQLEGPSARAGSASDQEDTLVDARQRFERDYILNSLHENNWNITKTAESLKLARKNLYKKMKDYRIL